MNTSDCNTEIVSAPTSQPTQHVKDFVIKYPQFEYGMVRLNECLQGAESNNPSCCACVAESGRGKSQLAQYFSAQHPRLSPVSGDIVPVLYVELLPGVTVKQLADQILHDLGDPLYRHGTALEKTLRIYELFAACKVRVLVLDEVNHFVDNRSLTIAHEAADWLKSLIKHTKVSVVLFGLERSLELLRQNEQLRRLFSTPFTIGQFDWDKPDERASFTKLLDAFQAKLPAYDLTILSDPDVHLRCYCASYGVIGYLSKILGEAVKAAKRLGTHVITLDLLSRAYVDQIWEDHPSSQNPFDLAVTPEPIKLTSSLGLHALKDQRRSARTK
jgi:DNA transposition AAA+ family ATPase